MNNYIQCKKLMINVYWFGALQVLYVLQKQYLCYNFKYGFPIKIFLALTQAPLISIELSYT